MKIGFWKILTLLLITLQLTEVINISWWAIVAIFLMPWIFVVLAITLAVTMSVILEKLKEKNEVRKF